MGFYMGEYLQTVNQNKHNFMKCIIKGRKFIPKELPDLKEPGSMAIIIFSSQNSKSIFIQKPSVFQNFLFCICDPCTPLSNY